MPTRTTPTDHATGFRFPGTGHGSSAEHHGSGWSLSTRNRHNPLSKKQKAVLGQLAAQAHRLQRDAGCLDDAEERDANAWRRRVQFEACGVVSLTEATQAHYRALLAAFEAFIPGMEGNAWEHRDDSGPLREDRAALWHQLCTEVRHWWTPEGKRELEHWIQRARAGVPFRDEEGILWPAPKFPPPLLGALGALSDGYALAICKAKFEVQVSSWDNLQHHLTAHQIDQLAFTLRNRARAKAGAGDRKNRNQSQRKG